MTLTIPEYKQLHDQSGNQHLKNEECETQSRIQLTQCGTQCDLPFCQRSIVCVFNCDITPFLSFFSYRGNLFQRCDIERPLANSKILSASNSTEHKFKPNQTGETQFFHRIITPPGGTDINTYQSVDGSRCARECSQYRSYEIREHNWENDSSADSSLSSRYCVPVHFATAK